MTELSTLENGVPAKSVDFVGRGGATERVDFGTKCPEEAERSLCRRVPKLTEGLFLMDGIKGLLSLPRHSVDMLLTDPPYGTTKNYWDVPLPLDALWEAVRWAVKPNGAALFFAQCPYDKVLGASNLAMLRYEWIWYKERGTGFLNANRAPLKKSENILVFYPCKDDPSRIVKRVRYICYGKTRKQTECDGQTGYTAHTLDGIIDKVVRQIFDRMKAIPKSEVVNIRYKEKMEERKSLLQSVRGEYAKAAADLETLKGEVLKTIRGESTFSKELLGSLIAEAEAKCADLQKSMEGAQTAYDEGKAVLATLNAQYDDIISWSEMYDTASMEAKKMIVSCLIKRVDVYRDYKLHIDFNIDFNQFSGGLDMITIAA